MAFVSPLYKMAFVSLRCKMAFVSLRYKMEDLHHRDFMCCQLQQCQAEITHFFYVSCGVMFSIPTLLHLSDTADILFSLLSLNALQRQVEDEVPTTTHPAWCIIKNHNEDGVRAIQLQADLSLGAFAKLRKTNISFVMSVRPSAWNNSAHIERIFVRLDISVFFKHTSKKISSFIKI